MSKDNLKGKEGITDTITINGNKAEMLKYLYAKYGEGKFLYFGDSLCGDILPTKDCKEWNSIGFVNNYVKDQ